MICIFNFLDKLFGALWGIAEVLFVVICIAGGLFLVLGIMSNIVNFFNKEPLADTNEDTLPLSPQEQHKKEEREEQRRKYGVWGSEAAWNAHNRHRGRMFSDTIYWNDGTFSSYFTSGWFHPTGHDLEYDD